jgi:SAM-dependent methyltransferase
MRYFDEREKTGKEYHLKKHPQWIKSIFNSVKGVHDLYDDCLLPLVKSDIRLLDAGCGKKGIMNKYKRKTALTVGVDIELNALKCNIAIDYKIVSKVENLPFKNGTFDVIISQWVVEHLPNPRLAFKEFNRVLKEKGSLILVTNSIYNPLMMFNAIMPQGIRDRIKKRLLPLEIKEDTFPTYYRCNSLSKIDRALRDLGYEKKIISYIGDPSFFIFSKLLFPLTLFYEVVTNIKLLSPLKMHIVAHYVKN